VRLYQKRGGELKCDSGDTPKVLFKLSIETGQRVK